MKIDQQGNLFKSLMAVSNISQIRTGTSHTLSDPSDGIVFNGSQYNMEDAIKLLEIQIAGAKLEHERNDRALKEAISCLHKLADELPGDSFPEVVPC